MKTNKEHSDLVEDALQRTAHEMETRIPDLSQKMAEKGAQMRQNRYTEDVAVNSSQSLV